MLVTLAGHDIFKGRALLKPSTPTDYSNFIVACLTHDIGYVRGIVKGGKDDGYVVDGTGRKISLPRGSSDAALAPYHVERSKLFVLDRVAAVEGLDSARIARAIASTQFPYASPTDKKQDEQGIDELGSLLRAADLIGQLGDPHYLRKANALYYEFEEIGLNRQLGYESPADIVDKYPQFYWNNISLHIQAVLSATSMLPRVGVGGLRASTATYFVPSVSYAIRGHSCKTCGQEVRHRCPCTNAARRACDSGSSAAVCMSMPTRRIRSPCCARATSGHAATIPPSNVMNSRRFTRSPRHASGLE